MPKGDSATCRGPRPIVLYGHGTTFSRGANTAAIRVNGTGRPLAIAYAGHGYIVVAPNYAGYRLSPSCRTTRISMHSNSRRT